MRISDWSSDVCSSDLFLKTGRALEFVPHAAAEEPRRSNQPLRPVAVDRINLVGEIANIGKYRPAGIRRQFAAQAEQRIGGHPRRSHIAQTFEFGALVARIQRRRELQPATKLKLVNEDRKSTRLNSSH